jgi:hypothetical protein
LFRDLVRGANFDGRPNRRESHLCLTLDRTPHKAQYSKAEGIPVNINREQKATLAPLDRYADTPHAHQCENCGQLWAHDPPTPFTQRKAHEEAHHCPECDQESWFVYQGKKLPEVLNDGRRCCTLANPVYKRPGRKIPRPPSWLRELMRAVENESSGFPSES